MEIGNHSSLLERLIRDTLRHEDNECVVILRGIRIAASRVMENPEEEINLGFLTAKKKHKRDIEDGGYSAHERTSIRRMYLFYNAF